MKKQDWYRAYFSEPYGQIYADYLLPPDMSRDEAELVRNALQLSESDAILDCPCGFGRHMTEFLPRFRGITGLDLDRDCLRRAALNLPRARLVRGDMRSLPFPDASFDAIANLFNSFGYFSMEENRQVVGEFARVLKPGGQVLFDLANPEPLRELVEEYPQTQQQVLDLTLTEEWKYTPETRILENRSRIRLGSKTLKRSYSIRLYTLDELRELLSGNGLVIAQTYGETSRKPYDEQESTRLIVVARKSSSGL